MSRNIKGISSTSIDDVAWGRRVTIFQDPSFPFIQLFGLDIPGRHHRKALAVEPSTSTPFPYDPHGSGMRVLKSGEVFKGTWGVTLEKL